VEETLSDPRSILNQPQHLRTVSPAVQWDLIDKSNIYIQSFGANTENTISCALSGRKFSAQNKAALHLRPK
jgi:hypothetical protein